MSILTQRVNGFRETSSLAKNMEMLFSSRAVGRLARDQALQRPVPLASTVLASFERIGTICTRRIVRDHIDESPVDNYIALWQCCCSYIVSMPG